MDQILNPNRISGALGQADPLRLRAIEMVIVHGERVLTKQQPYIAVATNSSDVVTQFNLLLQAVKVHGLIASE